MRIRELIEIQATMQACAKIGAKMATVVASLRGGSFVKLWCLLAAMYIWRLHFEGGGHRGRTPDNESTMCPGGITLGLCLLFFPQLGFALGVLTLFGKELHPWARLIPEIRWCSVTR